MLPPCCHSELGTLLWRYFLQAGYPSCHPTNGFKALKANLSMPVWIFMQPPSASNLHCALPHLSVSLSYSNGSNVVPAKFLVAKAAADE